MGEGGQPSFWGRTSRARTLVIRAGQDVLSIDGDDLSEIPKILTLYRSLCAAGHQALMLASGRHPETPNPTHGGPHPYGLHLWAWGLSADALKRFQGRAKCLRLSPMLRPHAP